MTSRQKPAPLSGTQRLSDVILDQGSFSVSNPDVAHERNIAIYDLLEANQFDVVGKAKGPYVLALSITENRLVFKITLEGGKPCTTVILSLSPFRRLIKDYFLVCESYFTAIKTAPPSRIEAIDMGRRGLHNEGSELVQARLRDKITIDGDTARRLFTLICALHWKG